MNNTSEAWQDGYDAGYAAGRKAERERGDDWRDLAREGAGRAVGDTSWNYEGLGGYGSQER